MEKQPKISVFIPAWNSQSFIAETIASVLSQDYPNIELIVVDNGSTDSTFSILKAIADKDPRLIVIHLDKGVSPFKARQIGYEKSTGDFCMNMDHDDCLAPGFFSSEMDFAHANNLDMISCKVQITDNEMKPISEKNLPEPSESFVVSSLDDCKFFLSQRYTGWDKLVKRTYLEKHNYRYDVDKEMGLFNFTFYDDCKNGFCPKAVYLYRSRPNSISHNFSNSIKLNRLSENSENPLYPLKENIQNPDKQKMLGCFIVKSLVPIVLFRSLGDSTYHWRRELRKIKRYYSYSFFNMFRYYRCFSFRTRKVAFATMFHLVWLLRLYISFHK